MNQLVNATLVLAGLLNFAACQKLADPEQAKNNARRLDERWATAFVNMDLNGIMDCYWNSPEATFFPPDTDEIRGYDGIKAWYEVYFVLNQVKDFKWVDTSYLALGDQALRFGRRSAALQAPNGQNVTVQGQGTALSGLRDGKWVYIHDHLSESPPVTTAKPGKTIRKPSKKKRR